LAARRIFVGFGSALAQMQHRKLAQILTAAKLARSAGVAATNARRLGYLSSQTSSIRNPL